MNRRFCFYVRLPEKSFFIRIVCGGGIFTVSAISRQRCCAGSGGISGRKIVCKYPSFTIVAAFIVLAMGISLLGLYTFELPMPKRFRPDKGGGPLKAFVLGIPFGLAASPCTAPLMITVLAFVATRGNPSFGFIMLFVYAFARSLPLLAVGTFSGLLQRLQWIAAWSGRIEKASGVLLIFLGLYLLW